MTRLPGVGGWLRDDRGSVAPMLPVIATMLLLLGGLVLDASRQLNLRGRALAYAEEAARAGAGAVQRETFLRLDPAAAQARVDDYCRAARSGGSVTECGLVAIENQGGNDPRRIVVRVRVRMAEPATLLGMVGVDRLTATGEARARPYEGVDDGDIDSFAQPVELPVPVDPGPWEVEGPDPLPLCDPLDPAVPCAPVDVVCGDEAPGEPCLPPCDEGVPGTPEDPCAPPCPVDPPEGAEPPVPCVPVEEPAP